MTSWCIETWLLKVKGSRLCRRSTKLEMILFSAIKKRNRKRSERSEIKEKCSHSTVGQNIDWGNVFKVKKGSCLRAFSSSGRTFLLWMGLSLFALRFNSLRRVEWIFLSTESFLYLKEICEAAGAQRQGSDLILHLTQIRLLNRKTYPQHCLILPSLKPDHLHVSF